MTATTMGAPRFEMGRVVNLMFGAIGRNWVVFGLLALLLSAFPQGLFQLVQTQITVSRLAVDGSPPQFNFSGSLLVLVGVAVSIAGNVIMQAALVHGVIVDLNGGKASFGDCLKTGLRFALPILGVGFLMALGIVAGALVFFVPGVMLALAWMVAVPAEVVERTGVFGAFSRSAALTRNHRWSLLGLCAIYVVVAWILSAAILAMSAGVQTAAQMIASRTPIVIAVTAIVRVVEAVVGAAGIAAIYYELRSIKEGIGPDALASVFD